MKKPSLATSLKGTRRDFRTFFHSIVAYRRREFKPKTIPSRTVERRCGCPVLLDKKLDNTRANSHKGWRGSKDSNAKNVTDGVASRLNLRPIPYNSSITLDLLQAVEKKPNPVHLPDPGTTWKDRFC